MSVHTEHPHTQEPQVRAGPVERAEQYPQQTVARGRQQRKAHSAVVHHSRPSVLTCCMTAAVLLHCILFFSPIWKTTDTTQALPPQESQGVEITLETLHEPTPEPPLAKETPPMPPPLPEPEPEPESEPEPQPVVSKPPEKPKPKPRPRVKPQQQAKPRQQSKPVQTRPSAPQVSETPKPAPRPPQALAAYSNRKPDYPKLARQRGQEGKVLLRVRVDATGGVQSVEVAKTSGHRLLDEAAVKSIQRWRFSPANENGKAVAGTVMVPVEFRLQ